MMELREGNHPERILKNPGQDQEGSKETYYGYDRIEMLDYIPTSAKRILEVGCAFGNFGALVKERRKAEIWGIERSPEAAEKAAARLDHVVIADVEQAGLDLPKNYFDCIVFNDVLEHLRYPWDVLKKCKELLSGDGCVVASIPNVMYVRVFLGLLLEKDWHYSDWGVLDRTHLRFFTAKSIKDMFEECGYSIATIKGLRATKFHWKVSLLNLILRHALDEMKYLQYAVVARPNELGFPKSGEREEKKSK